jgi:cobalamin synthase
MTGAWVGDRQAAWHWPLLGGLAGLICVAVFFLAIPLYFPCVFLGLYLCYFHLVGHAQRKDLRHPADEGPQR